MTPPPVQVVSFGYGHGSAPTAHLTFDLREHFRDPHVNPALRELTGHDRVVVDAVLSTPGILQLIDAIVVAVRAYQSGPSAGSVTVAVGCVGGKHRAVVVAEAVADRLGANLIHRDLHLPVIHR